MNPIRYSLQFIVFLLWSLITVNSAFAADDDPLQEQAINLIIETADRICVTIDPSGSSHVTEFSGEANVELSKILKVLADLGFKGAVKYQESGHQGVLREDLIEAINAHHNCKLAVFNKLEAKLIMPVTQSSSGEQNEKEQAIQPVLDPYNYEWKCKISIDNDEGTNLAAGELHFGKVLNKPKMAYARVKFSSIRTQRLDRKFTFDSGAWSLGYFGKCLEGECMGFISKKEPYLPAFLVNEVEFDEDNGRINISGVVMTKEYGKHKNLGLLQGVCTSK